MRMEWIRRIYGSHIKAGGRVIYSGGKTPRHGTITGAYGAHLRIRLDGDKRSRVFHPRWCIEYLPNDRA